MLSFLVLCLPPLEDEYCYVVFGCVTCYSRRSAMPYISASVSPFIYYYGNCDFETKSIDERNTGWWQEVVSSSVFVSVLKDQCSHAEWALITLINVMLLYPRLHCFRRKRKKEFDFRNLLTFCQMCNSL